MSNVAHLPDSMQRQWRVFERDLRDVILRNGLVPSHQVDGVLERIKPVYLKWAQPKSFDGTPEAAIESLDEWAYQMTTGLLTEIVAREIELVAAGLRD